jgi:hypothetical protein
MLTIYIYIYIVTVSKSSEIIQLQVTIAMDCSNMHERRLSSISHTSKQSSVSIKE